MAQGVWEDKNLSDAELKFQRANILLLLELYRLGYVPDATGVDVLIWSHYQLKELRKCALVSAGAYFAGGLALCANSPRRDHSEIDPRCEMQAAGVFFWVHP